MALADRVMETTQTTGTGPYVLGGAVAGYQGFAAAGLASYVWYAAADPSGNNWEVGYGSVVAGTLTRDGVLASSNGGALVNWGSGVKRVWCDLPAVLATPPALPVTAFGAIGNGASHPITQADINAHPRWVGTYAVGDEWDYVGCQECIYACFYNGTLTPNGSAHPERNRPLYFPPGVYLINKALLLTHLVGGRVLGAGRFVTSLTQTAANTPVIKTNGCAYSHFEGIKLAAGAANTGAVFELDWDNSAGGLALQSNTFADIYFEGNAQAAYGSRVGLTGFQGSENLFLDCFWNGCTTAGYQSNNSNALANTIVGGNVQACYNYGILAFKGTVNVYNTGFQNGTYSGGAVQQTGADIGISNSAGSDCSVAIGCRSESLIFLTAANNHIVSVLGCYVVPNLPNQRSWAANTAMILNNTVTVTDSSTPANGYLYVCTTPGTSGNSQPTWGAATVTDGTVTWTRFDGNVVTSFGGSFKNCFFPWGLWNVGQNSTTRKCVVENCGTTRGDWLSGQVSGTLMAQRDNYQCGSGNVAGGGITLLQPYQPPRLETLNFLNQTQTQTSSGTFINVGLTPTGNTQFTFPVGANETWEADVYLVGTTSQAGGSAGVKYQWTGPANPANVLITTEGNDGTGAFATDVQTAYTTPTRAYLALAQGATGSVRLHISVTNGSTAGTVALQWAAVTNLQNNQALVGSYMVARRLK